MTRTQLAKKLIASRSARETKRLLTENAGLADTRLAREIKEICYAAWTAEPAAAQRAARALDMLASSTNNNEIASIAEWVGGIAEITKSNLRSAAERLENASRSFRAIGRDHESAQPLVAALIALGMLGEYKEAKKVGRKALRIFEKYDDRLAAGKIEMNLSNIVSRLGKHRQAEEYCFSALKRFKRAGEPEWQAMAENGLANTYSELNEFKKAEKYFTAALETAKKAGMTLTVAEVESSLGNMALVRGRLGDALRLFELSRQKYEALRMPHQTAIAETEIAAIYAELNLTTEAAELYRRAADRFKKLSLTEEEARSRAGLARGAIKLGKMSVADRQFALATELFESRGNKAAAAMTRLDEALLQYRYRGATKSGEDMKRLVRSLRSLENPRYSLAGRWLEAETMAADEAEDKMADVFADALRSEYAGIELASLISLGNMALAGGDLGRAKRFFERAAVRIETSRSRLQADEFRMGYLAGNLEPYERLVEIELMKGDIDSAFTANERMRSRSLVESFDTSGDRLNDRKLGSEIRNLREKLNWHYRRTDDHGPAGSAARPSAARLEKKLATLERKLAGMASTKSDESREDVSSRAVRQMLAADAVLVEFIEMNDRFSAFVVRREGMDLAELTVTPNDVRQALEEMHFHFDSLKYGGEALKAFSDHVKARIDRVLRKLFDDLIGPLGITEQVQKLIVVPASLLNYVPFHALFDGAKYLIEKAEVSYSPSASVWLKLGRKGTPHAKRALLMAYADASIPLAEKEAQSISELFAQSLVLTGENATFDSFKANVGKADLVHLACHGTFRPDNPQFSSLHLADGWVTVGDVVREKIAAQLVTLSACETGMSEVYAGNEILGMVRGFLAAGARSLVASLWNINDKTTAGLMIEFYSYLQLGQGVAASLRKAQMSLIERGENPYYWAPFFAIQ